MATNIDQEIRARESELAAVEALVLSLRAGVGTEVYERLQKLLDDLTILRIKKASGRYP